MKSVHEQVRTQSVDCDTEMFAFCQRHGSVFTFEMKGQRIHLYRKWHFPVKSKKSISVLNVDKKQLCQSYLNFKLRVNRLTGKLLYKKYFYVYSTVKPCFYVGIYTYISSMHIQCKPAICVLHEYRKHLTLSLEVDFPTHSLK